ncbi:hypothetical protein BDV18DRAFT_129393 [Aspergillus unguis]
MQLTIDHNRVHGSLQVRVRCRLHAIVIHSSSSIQPFDAHCSLSHLDVQVVRASCLPDLVRRRLVLCQWPHSATNNDCLHPKLTGSSKEPLIRSTLILYISASTSQGLSQRLTANGTYPAPPQLNRARARVSFYMYTTYYFPEKERNPVINKNPESGA